MGSDLVEVIGGVEAELAGQAVAALRAAGIDVDVRVTAGVDSGTRLKLRRGEGADLDRLEPLYVRRPDAVIRRDPLTVRS